MTRAPEPLSAGRSALRALVIDDDPFMLDFIVDLLEQLGIGQIDSSASGSAFLATFDRTGRRPDLVLVDLQMPDQNGFQLLTSLAERRYDGGVILLSGQEDRMLNSATLMARFHQLQVLAALPKPVSLDDLARAIAALN